MIDKFDNEYAFLSNYYELPIWITDDYGVSYPTVEHYFQAAKTIDVKKRIEIAELKTPGQAKRAGRHLDLREDWEHIKVDVMRIGLMKKFEIPELKEKLLATDNELLKEGNWWHDNFWGSCNCNKCQDKGNNTLGHLLMMIREHNQTRRTNKK